MDLYTLLSLSALPAFLAVIVYLTDAIPEYARFLGGSNIKEFYLDEYLEKLKSPVILNINYFEFLCSKYDYFVFRLLSCPMCSIFWLVLLQSIIFGNIWYLPEIYVTSLLLFFGVKKLSS